MAWLVIVRICGFNNPCLNCFFKSAESSIFFHAHLSHRIRHHRCHSWIVGIWAAEGLPTKFPPPPSFVVNKKRKWVLTALRAASLNLLQLPAKLKRSWIMWTWMASILGSWYSSSLHFLLPKYRMAFYEFNLVKVSSFSVPATWWFVNEHQHQLHPIRSHLVSGARMISQTDHSAPLSSLAILTHSAIGQFVFRALEAMCDLQAIYPSCNNFTKSKLSQILIKMFWSISTGNLIWHPI